MHDPAAPARCTGGGDLPASLPTLLFSAYLRVWTERYTFP